MQLIGCESHIGQYIYFGTYEVTNQTHCINPYINFIVTSDATRSIRYFNKS